jgi:uncharacterized protein (UPF0248 family)
VVVYQAYGPSIADHAVRHQRFGGDFSFERMSWIKPNFLWMMYRSGWGTKEGQSRVLAVRIARTFFEHALTLAVPSSYLGLRYRTRDEWQSAVRTSDVRLQWDPDHDPQGQPLERRALQLGLRGSVLATYATDAVTEIIDVTDIVERERPHASAPYDRLEVPAEEVFVPHDPRATDAVGLSAHEAAPVAGVPIAGPDEAAEALPRFGTSREAYDFIKWDEVFDKTKFAFGYDAHDDELAEIAFEAFIPGGEIPWHRIWYIRHDREIVWDRKERIDRLKELRARLRR